MIISRLLPFFALCTSIYTVSAQTATGKVEVPDWALPGSATHKQVPPPLDFHRPAKTENKPIGIFRGQSDIGSALVPGRSSYNASNGQYTIVSAGYNIWYQRDEFRFIWKKMSGDVSLAANVAFPDAAGYNDRKAVLVIRQDLGDDSKEAVVALHGAGLIHLAWRPGRNQQMKEVRVNRKNGHTAANPGDSLDIGMAQRIGIEKHGNTFSVFVSMHGEPMHQAAQPIQLQIDGPFYVGLGFCSHLPATTDTAILSHVVLKNTAGMVR